MGGVTGATDAVSEGGAPVPRFSPGIGRAVAATLPGEGWGCASLTLGRTTERGAGGAAPKEERVFSKKESIVRRESAVCWAFLRSFS